MLTSRYAKAFRDDDGTEDLAQLGSALLVAPINAVGAFPTCNARTGQFDGAEKISDEEMDKTFEKSNNAE